MEVIKRLYFAPIHDTTARRNEDKIAVKVLVAALTQFVSAVAHLIALCEGNEKSSDGPHREMKMHLKVRVPTAS